MKTTASYLLERAQRLLDKQQYLDALNVLGEIDQNSVSPEEWAWCNLQYCQASMFLGRFDIRSRLQKVLDFYRTSHDDNNFALAKYISGWRQSSLGNFQDARETLLESYMTYKRVEDINGQARALFRLGTVCNELGEIDTAINYEKLSISLYDSVEAYKKKFSVMGSLGIMYMASGRFRAADNLYKELMPDYSEFSDVSKANAYMQHGLCHIFQGRYEDARTLLDKAKKHISASKTTTVNWYEFQGLLAHGEGRLDQAREHFFRVRDIHAESAPDSPSLAGVLVYLAELHIDLDDLSSAREFARQALPILEDATDRYKIGTCNRVLGRIESRLGNTALAKKHFDEAFRILANIGSEYELARTRLSAAKTAVFPPGEQQALLYLARHYFSREGMHHYIKEIDNQAGENGIPRRKADSQLESLPKIVTVNKTMRNILDLAYNIAPSEMSVLLTGDTGTGKDLIARHIHHYSNRQGRFVAVNAVALPENMAEAELFGYRRGAFTGADREKDGLIETAHNGTLYLNEIADTTPEFQAKLLDVLERRKVRRLGETREREIDFRLIAATNQDIEQAVKDGVFRIDLYHRINDIQLRLPPVSERLDDIPSLLAHFMTANGVSIVDNQDRLDFKRLVDAYSNRQWPGNIRQLKAEITRMCHLAKGDIGEMARSLDQPRLSSERERLLDILNRTNWNRREAARLLGVSDMTIRRRIKKYNLLQN